MLQVKDLDSRSPTHHFRHPQIHHADVAGAQHHPHHLRHTWLGRCARSHPALLCFPQTLGPAASAPASSHRTSPAQSLDMFLLHGQIGCMNPPSSCDTASLRIARIEGAQAPSAPSLMLQQFCRILSLGATIVRQTDPSYAAWQGLTLRDPAPSRRSSHRTPLLAAWASGLMKWLP